MDIDEEDEEEEESEGGRRKSKEERRNQGGMHGKRKEKGKARIEGLVKATATLWGGWLAFFYFLFV